MKYLITESQLSNIIFKYLDNQDFYKVEDGTDVYFWKSKWSWENSEYVIISARKWGDGFISSSLLVEISSMFSLSLEESLEVIGAWVNTQIDFNINHFYSDYGAD
jgi:hypothetical protein